MMEQKIWRQMGQVMMLYDHISLPQHRPQISCSTLTQHIFVLALADSLRSPAQHLSCIAGAGLSGQSPRRAPQRPRKPVQELMRPYYGEHSRGVCCAAI